MSGERSNETRRPRSYSVCSRSVHKIPVPLVTSLEVRGTEWLCMGCGARYPMFGAGSVDASDALFKEWTELWARYRAGERPAVSGE